MYDDDDLVVYIDIRRRCLLQDALKEGKKRFDTKKRLEVRNCLTWNMPSIEYNLTR